jgi:acetyltransferase-like isoleucine patch superfamily enzyme
MTHLINPKRYPKDGIFRKIRFLIWKACCSPLIALGFRNIDFYYLHGSNSKINKLKLGSGVSTADAIFNISSGNITIGDNTLLGHGVMILTGFHRFHNGKLAKLQPNSPKEVPDEGYDITIGNGCFLGSGVIVLSGLTIGDNTIIGAGAVVDKDIPSNVFAAGIPARIIYSNK